MWDTAQSSQLLALDSGALWWQPRVGETLLFFSFRWLPHWKLGGPWRRADLQPGGPGCSGVKGLGWLNSECVKAREIRLQRQTEVMINFPSLHTVSSLAYCCFSL